jgi:hypothetical protein
MAELKKKFTTKTLLEQIPLEKCWAINAKNLLAISVLRGVKTVMPLLGKGEGVFAPVWGLEKFREIIDKVQAEGGKRLYMRVKEMLNISVEDAIGADLLYNVIDALAFGTEWEHEYVEKTPKRVVIRTIKCPWMERYKEFEVDHGHIVCPTSHQLFGGEGLKAVNPKIIYTLTKAIPWGDPYCEGIIEFKED